MNRYSELFDTITVTEEPLGNSDSFAQGYDRAIDNLLAMLPLFIEQFDREHVGVTLRDRQLLRVFARFLEERLAVKNGGDDFVEDGLGI